MVPKPDPVTEAEQLVLHTLAHAFGDRPRDGDTLRRGLALAANTLINVELAAVAGAAKKAAIVPE